MFSNIPYKLEKKMKTHPHFIHPTCVLFQKVLKILLIYRLAEFAFLQKFKLTIDTIYDSYSLICSVSQTLNGPVVTSQIQEN